MDHYLDRLAHLRVALIGDLMLDCYITGEVRRISPEAPVPVVPSGIAAVSRRRGRERFRQPRRLGAAGPRGRRSR